MIERKRALAAINSMRTRIEQKYGVQVRGERRAHESGVGTDKKGNRVVHIGLADCPSIVGRGDVREIDFVHVALIMRHEERHLQQLKDLAGAFKADWPGWDDIWDMTERDRDRRVRDCGLVNGAMPGFHSVTYLRNFVEQDAELYAMQETRSFFKENYPEIDVDSLLVEIIQGGQHWYGRKADTVEKMEASLEAYLDGDVSAGAYDGICERVPKQGAGMMDAFKSDPANVDALDRCKSVEEQMNVLLCFIIAEERGKLKAIAMDEPGRALHQDAGREEVPWRIRLEEKAREEARRKAEREASGVYAPAGTHVQGGLSCDVADAAPDKQDGLDGPG